MQAIRFNELNLTFVDVIFGKASNSYCYRPIPTGLLNDVWQLAINELALENIARFRFNNLEIFKRVARKTV